jgi:hypothetical protein
MSRVLVTTGPAVDPAAAARRVATVVAGYANGAAAPATLVGLLVDNIPTR